MCGRESTRLEGFLLSSLECPIQTYRLIMFKMMFVHLLDIFTDIYYIATVPFYSPLIFYTSIYVMVLPVVSLLLNSNFRKKKNSFRRLIQYLTGYYGLSRLEYNEDGSPTTDEYKQWFVRNDLDHAIHCELELFFLFEDMPQFLL